MKCNAHRKNYLKRGILTKTLLVMKLTTMLLLVTCLQVTAKGIAQEQITLSEKNASLEKVLKSIKAQTGYTFFYMTELVEQAKTVSIDVKNANLKQVLEICFKDQSLTYAIVDKAITITPKKKELTGRNFEDYTVKADRVKGQIVNDQRMPIAGASIITKSGKIVALSNENGEFDFDNKTGETILFIEAIGYMRKEITLSSEKNNFVILEQATNKLDEIQIIGYGATTQRYSTGNAGTVKSEDISRQPVSNPLSTIQGRIAGVFVQNSLGLAGSQVNVQIRGQNSISGGNDPLYIVDGVPYPSAPLNPATSSILAANGPVSPLNSINPNDILSVSVLKDADATAIYGSRGSNGVILINTKKGREGKGSVDINVYSGFSNITRLVKTLDTKEYIKLRREAFNNDGLTPTIANSPELMLFDTTKYTDFPKYFLGGRAPVTNAQVSYSAGTNNDRMLLSANYRNEDDILVGRRNYTRGAFHLNIDHISTNRKLQLNINTTYTLDKNNTLSNNIASNSQINVAPDFPLYDSTGKLNFIGAPAGNSPVAFQRQTASIQTYNLLNNLLIKYNILPNLDAKISLGYNRLNMQNLMTFPLSSLNPANNPTNSARYSNSYSTTSIVEPQVTYTSNIGKGKLSVLLGGSYQNRNYYYLFIAGENYSNDNLLQSLSAAGNISTNQSKTTDYTLYKYLSGFSRLTYAWKEKYILNGTFRRDGSSRFGPGKQFGNFYSVGGAWIFTNEAFFKQASSIISFGKLRASYGTVGNDQITDYQYLSTYSSSGTYQGVSGLIPARLSNPDYSWEVNKKREIGLDLSFLKDRLALSVAWFNNRTSNQLVNYTLPTQSGFSSYQANLPATIQNAGWEIELNATPVKTKNFSWTTAANISFIGNKLLAFKNLSASSYANTYILDKPISLIKGYHFTGINPQTGIPSFSTVKGTDTIGPSFSTDRFFIGKMTPDYYGGLSNTMAYKNFRLDFLFQFVKQQGWSPTFWPGYNNTELKDGLNRWQKPGDITNIPRAATMQVSGPATTAVTPYLSSDQFWGDASYIRLKNIEISYTLPVKVLNKIKARTWRFYTQMQNLLTFTNYKGADPEIPSQSLTISNIRTIIIGTQLSF